MTNKSLYAAALDSELHHCGSLGQFCDLFGGPEPAFKWMHQKTHRTRNNRCVAKIGL